MQWALAVIIFAMAGTVHLPHTACDVHITCFFFPLPEAYYSYHFYWKLYFYKIMLPCY